jgi:PAS domain-containing protein
MPGSFLLNLAQLLHANPLMALAFLLCLATILWCVLLTRRQRNGLDKVLTALLGFIAVYQALRVMRDSGFAPFTHFRAMEGWVDLASASLYLVAAFILKISSIDRVATKVHLRLVEAEVGENDERALDRALDRHQGSVLAGLGDLGHALQDSSPLAIFTTDAHGVVTYWNSAAEHLLGWTRSELLGRQLPFDPAGPIQAKNGSFVEAAVWMSPIRSVQGPPAGNIVIAGGNAALHQAGLEFAAVKSAANR